MQGQHRLIPARKIDYCPAVVPYLPRLPVNPEKVGTELVRNLRYAVAPTLSMCKSTLFTDENVTDFGLDEAIRAFIVVLPFRVTYWFVDVPVSVMRST